LSNTVTNIQSNSASLYNNQNTTTLNNTRSNSRQLSVRRRPTSANSADKYEAYKQVAVRFFKSESSENLANTKKANNRGHNNFSVFDRPASAPQNKKAKKNSVLKQQNMIKAVAYRNGNRNHSVFIAAKNLVDVRLKQLFIFIQYRVSQKKVTTFNF